MLPGSVKCLMILSIVILQSVACSVSAQPEVIIFTGPASTTEDWAFAN